MNRRNLLLSFLSTGALSYLGIHKFFKSNKRVCCSIEDFWSTVKYEKEIENGQLQRNVYQVENYPTSSVFKRIKFDQLKKGDHFIILYSKLDYMGPYTGYGYISLAESDVFKSVGAVGVNTRSIHVKQCWTEEAFEKHMILSGCDYHSPRGHYKNGVRIG